MLKVVREIGHDAGLLVDVESVDRMLTASHRGHIVPREIATENLRRAFHARLEAQLVRPRPPVQFGGNEVELFQDHSRPRATTQIRHVELWKLPPSGPAGED